MNYKKIGYENFKLKQYEEAIKYYDKSTEEDSGNYYSYYRRGLAKYQLKQKVEALNDFNKCIEINPDNYLAYKNVGLIYFDLEQYDKALNYYKKSYELIKRYYPFFKVQTLIVYADIGDCEYRLKNYRQALIYYKEIILLSALILKRKKIPVILRVFYYYCRNLEQTYRNIKAEKELNIEHYLIDDYTEFIKRVPESAVLYERRADVYWRLKMYDKMLEDSNKAIESDDKLSRIYKLKGKYTERITKEYDKATENYKKAVIYSIRDKDNITMLCYMNLDDIRNKLGQLKELVQDYTDIIKEKSDIAIFYTERANAYTKLKQYDKAVKDYEKAIELYPENDYAYKNLIKVYKDTSFKDETKVKELEEKLKQLKNSD